MEQNVYKGLHDPATLTELCAMAIFMESFYHPAFKILRGKEANLKGSALDLGPFYDRVTEFLGAVAQKPDLVLENLSYREATFDGESWNRLEVVEAIHTMKPQLPHLHRCVGAIFRGAYEACPSFLSEFAEDAPLNTLTDEERKLFFRPPTNDCSEGDLGCLRLFFRDRQTKSTFLYNANRQYHENNAAAWEDRRAKDIPLFYEAVAKEARRQVTSKETEAAFVQIVTVTEARASTHRVELQQRKDKETEERERLGKIPQQVGLEWPKAKGVTKEALKDQLKKYRVLLKNPEYLGNISGNKETLIKQYLQAVDAWKNLES